MNLKCDLHSWMNSYIGVLAHPFFAVTGDDRSFALSNLPPGDYTIEAWHEVYGEFKQKVTVKAEGDTTLDFELSETKK